MITLKKLAYQAVNQALGGQITQDNPHRIPYVIQRTRQLVNDVLEIALTNNYSLGYMYAEPMFIATYKDIPIEDNGDGTGRLVLPGFFQHLPYNKGLHSIAPNDQPFNVYKRRLNIEVSRNIKYLDGMQGHVSWWQQGLEVYLKPLAKLKDKACIKVIVAAPDTVGIDDPLPITAEMQSKILLTLVQELMGKPPEDLINDNNPNLTQNAS